MLVQAFLLVALITASHSYSQSTVNATATATIVTPIGTDKLGDLLYSTSNNEAATVVLKPSENRNMLIRENQNDNVLKNTVSLKISSEAYSFILLVDAAPVNIKRTKGDETILADSFVTTINKFTGETFISVGATLYIENGQLPGLYSDKSHLNILVNFE